MNYKITDNDIYYMWGSNYSNNSRYKQSTDLWNDERKKLINGSKEDIINWAKRNLRPILDDNLEFIHRENWLPLDTLKGETQEILDNDIWNQTQKFIFENFKPNSKNLILQRCSSQKPYIDNSNYKFTKSLAEQGYCDLAVTSLEIIPIQFTIYYPFRYYDWNDAFETPKLTEYAIKRKTKRIIDFIDHFKYENILIFAPAFEGDTYYKIIYNNLLNHYKNTNIKIQFVMDSNTTKKCIEAMSGYVGLAKVRYSNLKPTQDRIKQLLGIKEIKTKKLW